MAIALVAAVLGGCADPQARPSTSPSVDISGTSRPSATATRGGLDAAIGARIVLARHWFTLPDPLFAERATIVAQFDADPAGGAPFVRLRPGGREAPLAVPLGPDQLAAYVDLAGIAPRTYGVDVVEHLRSGGEAVVASANIVVSAAEYVVWTLDFEGDAATDGALANTAAIADGLAIPMTIMWNPRVWTTTQVTSERAAAMLAWTKARSAKSDEIGLHIHAWTDFVGANGVTPRTTPNWAGRSDGYDVPLTAFDEDETGRLIAGGARGMSQHGLPLPTTFRAGGLFANAANLRAVASAGFTVDTSATPAGVFGRLPLPWTLAHDAQPYHPSATDANATGDLPLLELPNIAGNTFGYTPLSITTTIRDDLAMIAPAGQPAAARRVLTLVSHPATIDATERAAIEALFRSFEAYRYDRDVGPLRFVTASQLAQAFK